MGRQRHVARAVTFCAYCVFLATLRYAPAFGYPAGDFTNAVSCNCTTGEDEAGDNTSSLLPEFARQLAKSFADDIQEMIPVLDLFDVVTMHLYAEVLDDADDAKDLAEINRSAFGSDIVALRRSVAHEIETGQARIRDKHGSSIEIKPRMVSLDITTPAKAVADEGINIGCVIDPLDIEYVLDEHGEHNTDAPSSTRSSSSTTSRGHAKSNTLPSCDKCICMAMYCHGIVDSTEHGHMSSGDAVARMFIVYDVLKLEHPSNGSRRKLIEVVVVEHVFALSDDSEWHVVEK